MQIFNDKEVRQLRLATLVATSCRFRFRPGRASRNNSMSDPDATQLRAAESAFEVAIRAMGQALVDASAAAHEIAELDPPKDEQDADYDRLLWLGKITDGLGVLCTPRLRMLAAILDEVVELEDGEATENRHMAH